MNKNHYALVLVLLGGALFGTSFFGESNSSDNLLSQKTETLKPGTNNQNALNKEEHAVTLDFQLKDMSDTFRNIKEWHGKVLVLNFWATWCGPCRHEIPTFNALQKKYVQQNVQFIGLAYDDKAAIERFTSIIPIDYPILYGDDEVMELSIEYGNLQSVLPFTLFIAENGMVFHIAEGALSQEATERILAKVL